MSPTGAGEGRSVVITGTSTGIGAASALMLAEQGYGVFAGVRNGEDGEDLRRRATGDLTPLVLDITEGVSIAAAVATVQGELGGGGLYGLVNNAGIVKPGPLEFQPLDDFRRQLEVNLTGQLAMTQAFLPMIRSGGGRIVNVGSVGGHVVLPLHGAYSASKFGMEAITDALRLELRQWGIPVSLIDPGATETAIFGKTLKALDEVRQSLDDAGHSEYEGQVAAMRRLVEKTADGAAPVRALAETVAKVLTAAKPKSRYLAGTGAKAAVVLARTANDSVKDRAIAREAHLPKPEQAYAGRSPG